MTKDIVIFGNTEYSYMLAKYVKKYQGRTVIAFTVDKEYINEPYLHDIPVVPFEIIENLFSPQAVDILIGIGYKKMNTIRENVYHRIKNKSYTIASFYHPDAVIETTDIGEGNIVLSGAYVGIDSTIGNANIIWNNCNISHNAHIGDFNYFAPSASFGGFVDVEHHCFFGLNCTVRNNITIAASTLIGAGAYADKSTQIGDVLVPARSTKLDRKSFEMNI